MLKTKFKRKSQIYIPKRAILFEPFAAEFADEPRTPHLQTIPLFESRTPRQVEPGLGTEIRRSTTNLEGQQNLYSSS